MARATFWVVGGLLSAAVCAPAAGQVRYSTVALTGQEAPATGGQNFVAFDLPAIDPSGRVSFMASFGTPQDGQYPLGAWAGVPGDLRLLAKKGDPLPGGGTILIPIAPHFFGDRFLMGVAINDGSRGGQFVGRWGSAALTPVLVEGERAPGTGDGQVFGSVPTYATTVGRDGTHAASAYVIGGDATDLTSNGLWVGTPGDMRLVARAGSQAPGAPAGVVFDRDSRVSGVPIGLPLVDRHGNVTFHGNLSGPGVTAMNSNGVWHGTRDSLTMIARAGDVAPGTGGQNFLSTSPLVSAANGMVAFNAAVPAKAEPARPVIQSDSDPVPPPPDSAIYAGRPGDLRPVARGGDFAPGTAVPHVRFTSTPVINAAGDVAFVSERGVFVASGGFVRPVMLYETRAAGTPNDVFYINAQEPSINNVGQVAFFANVRGPAVPDDDTTGIWATDPAGELHLVVREGTMFDVGGGDLRLIKHLNFWTGANAGEDGTQTSFNDLGQVTFIALFNDNTTGVFVATVPEPAALAVLALALPVLLRRRRR